MTWDQQSWPPPPETPMNEVFTFFHHRLLESAVKMLLRSDDAT